MGHPQGFQCWSWSWKWVGGQAGRKVGFHGLAGGEEGQAPGKATSTNLVKKTINYSGATLQLNCARCSLTA